jgi:signal transduction histidine kinase
MSDFFTTNWVIILAIYGQAFFVLGLAIALQSWRHSRLALARNLGWLAAFGFIHALHEWGDIFIPLQAQYLPQPVIDLLVAVQAVFLAVSFVCLFQFGVEGLRPLPGRWLWVRALPGVAMLVWVGWAFGIAVRTTADMAQWQRSVNIWARYLIGFTGALVAAYGLRRQTTNLIAASAVPHIQRTLHVAWLALIGYAVLGGLVVPPGGFAPANWLNTVSFQRWTGIPVQVLRSLVGLALTVAIIRTLEVFRVELDRRLASMEETTVLAAERERIGRELHDGTLQTIYASGLLLQAAVKELPPDCAEPTQARLEQSMQLLNQAVADIRGYIGALRAPSSGSSLTAGLQELAADRSLRSAVEVRLALDLPADRPLTPARVGHLLAIANEALSNVARHAQATEVHLSASAAAGGLCLAIADNGRGLPADYVPGYGLRNIRDRARLLGGRMTLASEPDRGTTIKVEVPWSEEDEERRSPVAG